MSEKIILMTTQMSDCFVDKIVSEIEMTPFIEL
jgi:hypothetical protein